jgi:16S rRNA U516 pseudouridylate synthase RsuA-like enzyme
MTSAVGFPTLRLVRVKIGRYTIGAMQPAEIAQIVVEF